MARSWLITGTSSGFGRALTEELLDRGDRVAATVRDLAAMDELKRKYGSQLWVATLDVTDADAISQVVGAAFYALGRIDVVVNNAGYGLAGAAEELTDAQIRHQVDTNLIGSINVVRAALPYLREQGGGRVLQLSSMGGQMAFPGLSLYHATKWGIEGFIEATAQDVGPFGIEFTIVEPGSARTNFGGSSMAAGKPLPVYDATPVGELRRAATSGAFPTPGDPRKMAQAMIDSVYCRPAPRRLALGSDAYAMIRETLTGRIAELDAQRAVALSTDFDVEGSSTLVGSSRTQEMVDA
ncbi:SDR family oxidoreductase [Qipengyuania sp. GH1]|uniref:SDR family oxidoreductase n=1 Tax=Qipengyuania aestuarii TaxID=2867241 RepID=UPI001C87211C|nr:SDR family oxidoreductase [Qipengyuania aestuarii]MBX7535175.1 SDR family oxidoreductase [Qipengyuania aestuarii]